MMAGFPKMAETICKTGCPFGKYKQYANVFLHATMNLN